jgi:hypothetical protein
MKKLLSMMAWSSSTPPPPEEPPNPTTSAELFSTKLATGSVYITPSKVDVMAKEMRSTILPPKLPQPADVPSDATLALLMA